MNLSPSITAILASMVVTSAALMGSLQTRSEVEVGAALDLSASVIAAALSAFPASWRSKTRSISAAKSASADLPALWCFLGVLPVLPPVPLVPASSPVDTRRVWT